MEWKNMLRLSICVGEDYSNCLNRDVWELWDGWAKEDFLFFLMFTTSDSGLNSVIWSHPRPYP